MRPRHEARGAILLPKLIHHQDKAEEWPIGGVAPDIDGLTILAGTESYSRYHHVVTHGLIAAIATGAIAYEISNQRVMALLLSVATFHLHLLCDLAGSGPGWPIK